MKHLLRIMLTSLAVLVVGLCFLAAIFVVFPQTIVNGIALNFAKEKFSEIVDWKELGVDIHSVSLWTKAISVDAVDLKVSTESLKLGIPKASVNATIHIAPWDFRVEVFGPAMASGVTLLARSSTESGGAEEPFDIDTYLSLIDGIIFKRTVLTVDTIEFASGEQSTTYGGRLLLSGLHENPEDQLTVEIFGDKGASLKQAVLSASVQGYKSLLDSNATLTVDAEVSMKTGSAKVDMKLLPSSKGKQEFLLNGKSTIDRRRIAFDAKGVLDGSQLESSLTVSAKDLVPRVPDFKLDPCKLVAHWGDSVHDDIKLKLNCDSSMSRAESIEEQLVGIFAPKDLRFKVVSEIDIKNHGKSKRIETDTNLAINQTHDELVDLRGSAAIRGKFDFANEHSHENIALVLDLSAHVDDFKMIVDRLKGTSLEVPAPANQLGGPAACGLRGNFSVSDFEGKFPFDCKLDLSSSEQRLLTESTGSVSLRQSPTGPVPVLDLDVTIDGIELVLPSLEIGENMPALAPDSRIVLHEKKIKQSQTNKESDANIIYNIRIRSKKRNSILIHSNLAKSPVPVSVHAVAKSGEPVTGEVSVDNFSVELLRRKAEVVRFDVALADGPGDQKLDGLVRFDNNDYKIDLKIFGTAAKPEYSFESDPPLPQSDLMAVLLFGKKPDALDRDKLRTVDETRAAVADGAVNLLSMYYLAATPVESVGYNPHTGIFSAKVNLQKGLSMTVGTDVEAQKEVGLRKRLGAGWSVETTAISNDESNAKKGIAMLRWGRRY